MLKKIVLVTLVSLTSLCCNVFAGSDNIDVALTQTVPILMQRLKEEGVKTVGVLPFRLKQGNQGDRYSGATIQTNLALRVEQALVFYRDPDRPVDVIFGMLAQARKIRPDAQYLDSAGRKALFENKYQLFVGDEKLAPDAFVTGQVEVSSDWRDTKIYFEYCLASEPSKVIKSGPYELKTDRKMLVSMGKGFGISTKVTSSRSIDSALVMEGVQQDVDFQIQEDRKSGITIPEQRIGKPVPSDLFLSAPVTLTVKYDGQPQSFMKDAVAGSTNLTINDPKNGQRVTFELKNNTDQKVAVVLSINGRSLLYNEYAANPDDLSKFVLEPGKTYSVPGIYQRDNKSVQPVLGQSDSATSEIARKIPSEALGMIHMFVYQQTKPTSGSTNLAEGKPSNSNGQTTNRIPSDTSKPPQGNSLNGGAKDSGRQQQASQSPKIERSEIEQWKSGFNFSLARATGTETQRANGSFTPIDPGTRAKSWDELADQVAKNVVSPPNTSKGLMLGEGGVQSQDIQLSQIGTIQLSHAYVIRYLGLVR